MNNFDYRFCVAPMMDWTDPHERYFLRLISRRARLYTEMVTTGAVIFGDRNRFLALSAEEHPVALQLGGSDPEDMALCAKLGEDAGFDEININVGCPSDRVQAGRFGACLMREPRLVAECINEMRARVSIPVTVKCRIGVDRSDSYEELCEFTQQMSDAGCEVIIVHARKAWLSGLSPKENREIPPLNYPRVYALKRQFPELTVVINGGITTLDEASRHLSQVDGVMVGRGTMGAPWLVGQIEATFMNRPIPSTPDSGARLHLAKEQLHDLVLSRGSHGLLIARKHMSWTCTGFPGASQLRHALMRAPTPDDAYQLLNNAIDTLSEVREPKVTASVKPTAISSSNNQNQSKSP